MKREWLQALARIPYGVYVLTSRSRRSTGVMIASWVSQVSYDPPLIMAALHERRFLHHVIRDSGAFALNLLSREQGPLVRDHIGSRSKDPLDAASWFEGKTGSPLLKDALGYLDCRLRTSYSPGNHTLYIGEIVEAAAQEDGPALMTVDLEGSYTGRQ